MRSKKSTITHTLSHSRLSVGAGIRILGGNLHRYGFAVSFLPLSRDLGLSHTAPKDKGVKLRCPVRNNTGAIWLVPCASGFWGHTTTYESHIYAILNRMASRAGLVARAEERLWSSLRDRSQVSGDEFVDPGPVALPEGWVEWVDSIPLLLGLDFPLLPGSPPRRSKKKENGPFSLSRPPFCGIEVS